MEETLQQRLLDVIQSGFPLEVNPYDVLANRFSVDRQQIKDALAGLYAEGGVRRIGASFDSRKLGYTSTLCALAVPGTEEDLAQAAEVVSRVPGVTHNYGRAHRYNLWFTLIIRSEEEKQAILDWIRTSTGCNDLLDMPSTNRYKISVDFGQQRAQQRGQNVAMYRFVDGWGKPVRGEGSTRPAAGSDAALAQGSLDAAEHESTPFNAADSFDIELVRWAQGDIARDSEGRLFDDPFEAGAEYLNTRLNRDDITAEAVLKRLRTLKEDKTIRRFGAMVRHQIIGFDYNSMTVWDVPDEQVDQAGALFAQSPFVSHCYTRRRYESWPTNLYAMTHAESAEELQENIDALAAILAEAGITCNGHFALESTAEYKKISMSYFTEEEDAFLAMLTPGAATTTTASVAVAG